VDLSLYTKRAENELKLAKIVFKISEEPKIQRETFDIREPETYYSSVIAHCYYAIFYSAKAYLLKKGVKVDSPEVHKKAFEAFKKFVDSGELDVELLRIYQEALVRADVLLGIFKEEKSKRGKFTYRTLPQANREPANESILRAQKFLQNILLLCES